MDASDIHAPLRVLAVEDDPVARDALRIGITSMGHECVLASDGVEARALHALHPVDVIVTDWMMPNMSGIELCRRVREQPGPYVYVIVMTALDGRARFLEAMHAGADDYVHKPVDLDALEARLLAAGRVIRLQRELAERNAALRRESERSFEIARIDPLTHIANRLQLDEDLERLRSHATPRRRACAAMCDVDHFKGFNDRFGHPAGDAALRRIAQAMRDSLRGRDSLYRYGGEEFLVLLPGQSLADAERAMDRVLAAVRRLAIPHPLGSSSVLTVSAGIAELHPLEAPDAWIQRADEALYRAKSRGRDRVELAA